MFQTVYQLFLILQYARSKNNLSDNVFKRKQDYLGDWVNDKTSIHVE